MAFLLITICTLTHCSVQEEAFEAAALLIVLRLWRVIRIVNGRHDVVDFVWCNSCGRFLPEAVPRPAGIVVCWFVCLFVCL